jgi:hypothetical protein
MPIATLAEINCRNSEFWKKENILFAQRLSNETVRSVAFKILQDQVTRAVPLKWWKDLNAALEDAGNLQKQFATEAARKGGRARKTDALQTLIEQIVARKPNITQAQLLAELERCCEARDVSEIDNGTIYFESTKGSLKTAKLSGLKDRLSRAKKKLRSR